MKKFVFTLQAVYGYKQTVEKLQKTELKQAQEALRQLLEEERRLIEAFERNKRELEEALEKNIEVAQALIEHDAHFRYLRAAREELLLKIQRAEQEKEEREQALITTMKELKAYENLRQEQYQQYLKEVQLEEEKVMGDLVSFKFIDGDFAQ